VSAPRDEDEAMIARLSEAARADARRATRDAAPLAWQGLRLARERERRRARVRARWALPAIAAGLALAGGAFWARRSTPLTYVVSGGQVEANGYVASGAAPAELRFSDGTHVRLARGARMSVAASGPHGARLRVEDGLAHFEVTHLPGADWSVEAGPYRVQVTGTVFDVSWSGGDEARVALHVGSVRVTGPHLAAPVTLTAGQRIVARLATAEVRLDSGALEPAAPRATPSLAAPSREAPVPAASAPAPDAPTPAAPPPREEPEAEAAPPRARPRPTRAKPARPTAASVVAPGEWARRVANGDATAVLAEAQAGGFDEVTGSVEAGPLAALADAARYAGERTLCERALLELRRRFPASAQAHTAAFQLGRLADDADDAPDAVVWYRRYAEEAPRGAYAAEAFGREMLDVERLEGRPAAVPLARAYLARFPEGTYFLQARAILGLP